MQRLADSTGPDIACRAAAGIIGRDDLKLVERVTPVLEALQAASPNRFRGVRHAVSWHPHPELANREVERCLAHHDFRARAKVLAAMGHCLEIADCFSQLAELASFARALHNVPIVLSRSGGLILAYTRAGRFAEVTTKRKRAIHSVAYFPNIVIKFVAAGMPRFGFDWHPRAKPVESHELTESIASPAPVASRSSTSTADCSKAPSQRTKSPSRTTSFITPSNAFLRSIWRPRGGLCSAATLSVCTGFSSPQTAQRSQILVSFFS